MCFQILWFSDGPKSIFGMDKILLCINSTVRPHLIVRPCNATLSPMFSFHQVWSSSWQNCQSLLCLLLMASSVFFVLCFTLDILCSVTLLREQCKASIAKQLHYFRLLILTHPLCCRSFENDKKKKSLSCLSISHDCWAFLTGFGFGKPSWTKWLSLLSQFSYFFSSFVKRKPFFSWKCNSF